MCTRFTQPRRACRLVARVCQAHPDTVSVDIFTVSVFNSTRSDTVTRAEHREASRQTTQTNIREHHCPPLSVSWLSSSLSCGRPVYYCVASCGVAYLHASGNDTLKLRRQQSKRNGVYLKYCECGVCLVWYTILFV